MAGSIRSLFNGDFPSRFICFVLGIASLTLAAILRNQHDPESFGPPLSLAIVAAVWFGVTSAMSIWLWFYDVCFCPRRAASLIVIGLAIVGVCAACAGVTASTDKPDSNTHGTMRRAIIGLQISSAILEFVNVVTTAIQFFKWHREGLRKHSTASEHYPLSSV